ncbi:J domain-containing protein [Acanthopleuribacter pedis]|uniref:J domain-containing protein n=1 Tax=Acanthopleuribacter pedis TaxID=442870 RepID=A0A8J7U508_9BACT|nr:J domain-containing protein [Acanthopleuribacter pedis]MBO1320008.1 J domain-containing protein [Acanthopleuribacter pedis]
MDHYRTLQVSRHCSREELHKAFRRLSKSNHPDSFPESERDQAEKKYQQIVVAFNTLKDPRQREKYDKTLDLGAPAGRPQVDESNEARAARYLKMGQMRYEKNLYDQAVEALKRAVYFQETAEGWFYKGLAEIKVSGMGKEGVRSLERAISMDSRNGSYYAALVRSLMHFGLKTRARNALQKGLQMAPGDRELRALAREMEPEEVQKDKSAKKGGLLGGLFGKK